MTGRRLAAALFVSAVLALASAGPAAQNRDEIALRAAIETETIKGDLQSAIEQYRKLAGSGERVVAAQALLRLAGCYEKLGRSEAAATYAEVAQKFRDQPLVVAEAQRRIDSAALAVLARGPSVELLLTTRDNRVYGQSVSRDGRYIAVQDRRWIWTVDLVTGEKKLLASPTTPEVGLLEPLISPDGRFVAFVERSVETRNVTTSPPASREGRLEIVSSDGTGRRTLASLPGLEPLDWSPDGTQVLVHSGGRPGRFVLVSVGGGTPTELPFPPGIARARFSPDGRYLAISGTRSGQALMTFRLADGETSVLIENNGLLAEWSPDGSRILFTRGGNLQGESDIWFIRTVDGRAYGEPQFVRGGVPYLLGATRDGGYLYRTGNSARNMYTVDIDPASGAMVGRPREIGNGGSDNRSPAISPDGAKLAFLSMALPPAAPRLLIRDLSNNRQRQVDLSSAQSGPDGLRGALAPAQQPEWLADSRSLIIPRVGAPLVRVETETGSLTAVLPDFRLPASGAGVYASATDLGPDGRHLYYVVNVPSPDPADAPLVSRIDLETGTTTEILRAHGRINGIGLSPDGTEIAYVVMDGEGMGNRHASVMIAPVSGGAPRNVFGVDGIALRDVVWGRDGQRLFMTSSINRFDGPITTEVGADIWTVRIDGTDAKPLGIGLNDQYYLNIHPNGRQLIFMDENYRNELWIMRNLFPTAPDTSRRQAP